MSIQLINPPGLVVPETYAQVGVATGRRTIYLAGQVAQDPSGAIVGVGDLAAQTEQALMNVATALEAAGATFADVAKITLYVVGLRPELIGALGEGLARVAARMKIDPRRPSTLIGVQALAHPDLLVELDVIAVLDQVRETP
jgi:enamine deaminase RidA (YjgF/YER057c/UK114 family)